MADLNAKFEKAAVDVQKLKQKPDNDTLLKWPIAGNQNQLFRNL